MTKDNLKPQAYESLNEYAGLIWQKKDDLNLTSVQDRREIWDRHIADGLAAAGVMEKFGAGAGSLIADFGAGAGYIGFALAAYFPESKIFLVESLEKRCNFMRWAAMKTGLKNIEVAQKRVGEDFFTKFDFVTERAMGKLDDILPLCMDRVKEGGYFLAFQSEKYLLDTGVKKRLGIESCVAEPYVLPSEEKERFLAVFKKGK